MKLGKYTLRSPIVKYVEMDIGEELYKAIRLSIVEDMINDLKSDHKYDIELLKALKETI